MTVFGTDIEIRGRQEAVARLNRLAKQAQNTRPAMVLISEIMADGLRKNVETQGRWFNRPWPPLSAATAARKGHSRVLEGDTNRLLESLRGGPKATKRVSKYSVTVGTRDFRARFHQFGSSGAKRGGPIPERRLVDVAPQDAVVILRTIREHVTV